MPLSQIFLAVAIVASWGLNAAISKIVVTQIPTLAFLSLRFFATALIFMPFAKLHKKDLGRLFKIAMLLNVGHFSFTFYSLKYLSAASFSVIQQIQVPLALLLGAVFLHEKITKRQIIGIILAFCGILCIFGLPNLNLTGFILTFMGCLFWAISQLELKKSQAIDLYTFISFTTLFASPVLFGLSLIYEGSILTALIETPKAPLLFSFFYQVVILGAAMMLWQRLVANNGIAKVVPVMLLQVLFGILGGVLIFNESLNWNITIGAFFTMTGVGLAMIKSHPKAKIIQISEELKEAAE